MRQIILLVILFYSHVLDCTAQVHPFLERFQAAEVEGIVVLSWTLKAGNTCNGVQIQRSAGSSSFKEIGEIPGVCGSVDDDVDYIFLDSLPVLNTPNRYRLELGNEGISQVIEIQINGLRNNDYQIRPHPVSQRSVLLFKNDQRQKLTLQFTDMNGKLVLEIVTEQDYFTIDRNDFSAGFLLFTIRDQRGQLTNAGKVVLAP
jgi:hypothetical protein